jgi:hypothetical protein
VRNRLSALVYWCAAAAAAHVLLSAQQLPSEPQRQFGTSITGAFEGWFDNPDGSRSFLVGYLNRNTTQPLDVPIGPNNHIDPGGPDLGQPTHFLPGRHWGMFTVTVPKAFTTPEHRLTWTIVANGQAMTIPLRLHPDYSVSPLTDVAVKNTPPLVQFEEQGPAVQGPRSCREPSFAALALGRRCRCRCGPPTMRGLRAGRWRCRGPCRRQWSSPGRSIVDRASLRSPRISRPSRRWPAAG